MAGAPQDLDKTITELHEKVRKMIDQNVCEENIVDELGKVGLEPAYVRMLIENVRNDIQDKTLFRQHLITGGGMIIGGIALNYLSYQVAVRNGALFFYIFWGVIAWGFVLVVRALVLFRK